MSTGPGDTHPDVEGLSLGTLMGRLTEDLSRLVRQEIELAKAEAKEEATKAGIGAGLLGGAGVATLLVLIFGTLTLVYALSNVMEPALAGLIVTVVWAAVAAVLAVVGRDRLRSARPLPQTTETLKEDVRWAKHPTS